MKKLTMNLSAIANVGAFALEPQPTLTQKTFSKDTQLANLRIATKLKKEVVLTYKKLKE